MSLNFNVDPYYDDFSPDKNYHRILFKPGFAVQARELTQSQSILQDQITKFADHVFKQNSPVTGGQITTNFDCYYIKLLPTYNNSPIDVDQFNGILVKNNTGTVIAQVIAVAASTGTDGDPDTLIVIYKTGTQFTDSDVIYGLLDNSLAVQALSSQSTGLSSVASIAQGVFYVSSNYTRSDGIVISNGNFVQVNPQTIILSKYSNTPSNRVGLDITETIYDYVSDTSLLDPAIGASNYQAPGADRYVITLTLETRPLTFGDDDGFIELIRVTNGNVAKLVDGSVYNVIDDYFAKRDYETNGDYVVNDFKLTPKTNTLDASNNTYVMSVGKGIAYVHGYRVESQVPTDIISNRARTSSSQNNNPVFIDYGSYFYVDTVRGANGSFFDTTTYQPVDFHCVPSSNIATANANVYNSTVVASGYIRGLVFDNNSNTADTTANSYVYRAYVSDLQNAVQSSNAVSATSSTITLPSKYSSYSNAYYGVTISITNGTNAGDFRTIVSYNGASKVATVNQNWTVTPDTTSVFALNFGTADIECIANTSPKTSYPLTVYATAQIDVESKTAGVDLGDTQLQNPTLPELIFSIGNPYVSTLSDASYTTQQEWRGIAFTSSGSGVSATLPYTGGYLGVIRHLGTLNATQSASLVQQNFTVIVTNAGTSTLKVGDNIPWTNTATRTVTLDATGGTATLAITDAGGTFTATVLAKVFVTNGDNTGYILKNKYLINANTNIAYVSGTQTNTYTFVDDTTLTSTGQVYIQNSGLVSPGNKQSLYLSDVKSIVKILDTGSSVVFPTTANLSSYIDVTNRYIFDNGQRDNYYDHASLTLLPGATQPKGNLLVFVNYYQHSGGDGYFGVNSYTNDTYQSLPRYTSKNGTTYDLRDCLDFRPARKNAVSTFEFRYSNSATNYGVFLPLDLSTFTSDYSYYLGRHDKLILTKDKTFKMIEGTPSINPIFPSEPDGSLVLAELKHNPYTGYIPTEAPNGFVSDLSIDKVKHKRYTMRDIAGIESRINNIEYYTSLSLLEQNASALQITDSYGLNRFKNGIMVDDFSSYSVADTNNNDYLATINRRIGQMTATQNIKNFPLKSINLAYNLGTPSSTTLSNLGYNVSSDGYTNYFSLPISSTANVTSQVFASRTVNVNPFSYHQREGVVSLTPNVDNWVDTNYAPSLLITDPDLQIFRANSQAINVLSAGDWQTVSGTSSTTSQSFVNHGAFNGPFGTNIGFTETTTTTVNSQKQTNILGNYDKLDNTYALNNGYITDISILPYIRPQQVAVRAKNLLFQTPVVAYFDNTSVTKYIRKTNVIELSNVSGTFNEDDVIGYFNSSIFTPTGIVIGVYVYTGTTNVRLYVAGDWATTNYRPTGVFQNGFFDINGNFASTTASGTITNTHHHAGSIVNVNSTTSIKLSALANTTSGWYTGNTIYFCAGTGVGQSATISNYYGANQVAILASSVSVANGDVYSIGSMSTDEVGSAYAIFNLPGNTFHTGQRVLRIDNSTGGNQTSATTYAEGTYYAEGLQTTFQGVDFGASPAGAKNTFTQTNSQTTTSVQTYYTPYDPVAQTFLIEGSNYPNGVFLNDIKVYFRTKPSDNSPITLSIVGTLNGYPNGSTLDHSVITLTPDKIKVSENPHYLDSSAFTTFTFTAPVYISPNSLYAFILKSSSNQYTLWTASNGDIAVAASTKNLPTDPTPTTVTKIGGAPYVGALFLSQNSQTWTAEQNQSLMFVMNRCVFNTSVTPSIQFVVPKKLPQRTLIDQSVDYFLNANSISSSIDAVSNTDILVDAFNVTTTDFVPTTTNITYNYNAMLTSGTTTASTNITPGKYGTSASDNIYLNDGQGQRKLFANLSQTFSVYTQLSSNDNTVSPIISDAGLTAYAITWNINNCPLSNSLITVVNGGSGYNANTTSVTISSPTGAGASQAYASANIVGGVIESIFVTTPGSGYITTPTITIADANTSPGTGASVRIAGETSATGGPAIAKYVTKKVVLDAGNDSGDLNVYLTAYRPVNTDINVYYKILNRNDTQSFENSSWQLMTKTNSSGSSYSQTRTDLYEYKFAPGTGGTDQGYISYTSTNGQTYTTFSQFAIKVVLTSTDNTAVPFISDIRAIALPSNIGNSI
jgi:hypothetical protein